MRHVFWKIYSTDVDSSSFCEKSEYFFKDREKALDLARTLIGKKIPSIPEEDVFLNILPDPKRLLMKTQLLNIEVDESEDSITFEAIYDAEFYEIVSKGDVVHVNTGWAEVALTPHNNGTLKCLGNAYLRDQYFETASISFTPKRGYERWYAVRRIDVCREIIETED